MVKRTSQKITFDVDVLFHFEMTFLYVFAEIICGLQQIYVQLGVTYAVIDKDCYAQTPNR